MTHAGACFFEDGFYITKRLTGLFLDAAFDERACCRVDRNLTRCIDKIPYSDGLTIRADGSGCLWGADSLFHTFFLFYGCKDNKKSSIFYILKGSFFAKYLTIGISDSFESSYLCSRKH